MEHKTIINEIIQKYNEQTIESDIYIVADLQKKTAQESDRRIIHADESEFFSRSEFAEIASAIFNVFGFVRVFYSEIEFIEYFIHNNINPKKSIVYNLSRDGTHQGKKSLIPAFCDLYNIMYTGCNAFTISLLRNKSIYTDLLAKGNVNVPTSVVFSPKNNNISEIIKYFNKKDIIIKNIWESASIGLKESCKMNFTQHDSNIFYETAKKVNSNHVLVQEYIDGIECEVLVLQYNGHYFALDPIEIKLPQNKKFMDSEISNNYSYSFALLNKEYIDAVCIAAERSAAILNIKDYARFDFRIKDGIPYLFDIAGTPYTIQHSSIAYIFNKYGFKYEDIYKTIIFCMLSNYNNEVPNQ